MKHKLLVVCSCVLLLGAGAAVALAYTPTAEPGRTESVFVYGTLKNPIIRMLTCRCRVDATPAAVSDYEKVGRNIVSRSESSVNGFVIHVTPEELAHLDNYEDVPEQYVRRRITILDGTEHWVYLKTESLSPPPNI